MTYQPLHHKYRPQTFAELVGQPAIATTLSQAIATDKIAPAYLFSGPRGTGKTSSARIFAKSLNCLASSVPTPTPCGTCESCQAIARSAALDVIELDAASNTGVDNIRELIERAQFAPVRGRYKLYLIDEVHMLSTAAFNALLKTLEEPPPRVVFVLATTDPQRVLPTIISRCQRFDFRRIPLPELTAHLEKIARLEEIDLTPGAIAQVAQLANGGLRDAESLLDQLGLLSGKIDVEQVWDLVGSIPERDLLAIVRSLRTGDTVATLAQTRQLLDRGREPLMLLQSLAGFFRDLLVAQAAPERGDLAALTPPVWEQLCTEATHWTRDRILAAQRSLKASEVQIKNAAQPRLWLEIALLSLEAPAATIDSTVATGEVANGAASIPKEATKETVSVAPARPELQPEVETAATETAIATPAPVSLPAPPAVETAPTTPTPAASESSTNLQPLWRQVMAQLPPATKALVSQHCRLLALDGTVATVGIRNANLLRLAESKKPNLETAFTAVCQQETRVQLQVAPADFATVEPTARSSPTDPPPSSPPVATPPPPAIPQQPAIPPTDPQRDRQAPPPKAPPPVAARPRSAQPQAKTAPPASQEANVPADLQAAVRALSGDFNGTPIDLSDRTDWQEMPPAIDRDSLDEGDRDGFAEFGSAPDAASDPDDDEVPFARQPPAGEPWDPWEVAAHWPGPLPGDRYRASDPD